VLLVESQCFFGLSDFSQSLNNSDFLKDQADLHFWIEIKMYFIILSSLVHMEFHFKGCIFYDLEIPLKT